MGKNSILVKVLVLLVVMTRVSADSSTKSKSRSSKSKASTSSRTEHKEPDEYAPRMLKPSKPDPHFEVLDEQRGIDFGSRLRDGRDSSSNQKPTKLAEIKKPSHSSSSSSHHREKTRHSVLSSRESEGFTQNSVEFFERPKPTFSGSPLISGDDGSMSFSRRTEAVEKDGWKILRGPSVSSQSDHIYDDTDMSRSFTSMTDTGNHRKITRLSPAKKGKSIITNSHKYHDVNDMDSARKISKLIEAELEDFPSSPVRKRMSEKNRQISIPKQKLEHKYATITRRTPSKSGYATIMKPDKVMNSASKNRYKSIERSVPKIKRPSKQIKSSLETRYASIENDLNRVSPVMTLDTKKLVLEPMDSPANPTIVTSMSNEYSSGEHRLQISPSSSTKYKMESRYDPITLPMHDMSAEYSNGNPHDDGFDTHFETKTALASAEFPLISVSSSMSYPSKNRRGEPGGIITGSSFSNLNLHVDEPGHSFPDFKQIPGPSHFGEVSSEALKSFLEADNLPPNPLASPHVEFVGVGSKSFVPPPLSEQAGAQKIALSGRIVNSKSQATRLNLPLLESQQLHHPSSLVLDENSLLIPTRYNPTFSVDSSHDLPFSQGSLQRERENFQPHHQIPPTGPRTYAGPILLHPTPHHHLHHPHLQRRPLHHPIPIGALRTPLPRPVEIGSGRKASGTGAPPGNFVIEIGKGPPPPPGVDPAHPAVQHALKNPHALLNDGFFIEPNEASNIQEKTKNYLHSLQYQAHPNTLIPLDKRLVYLTMIFSWMFWLTTFYTYSRWSLSGNKAKQVVLNVPKDGELPQVTARHHERMHIGDYVSSTYVQVNLKIVRPKKAIWTTDHSK